jgi:endoglucanase
MKQVLLSVIASFFSLFTFATHLTNVKPISNKIIELTFIDGEMNFHNLGQSRSDDSVTLFAGGRLSNAEAKTVSNYAITSSNDANYTSVRLPIDIGLNKRIEQNWALDIFGRPTHIEEIHVYLFLDSALTQNKIYTITANGASVNTLAKTLSFTFNTNNTFSESVHVNNIGYVPSAQSKFGYVYAWLGDHEYLKLENDSFIKQKPIASPRTFNLRDISTNAIVFTGNVAFRKPFNQVEFGQWGTTNNNFAGADIYECDFSTFNTIGSYVLEVEGIGCSYSFKIDDDIYYEPLFYTLKNLYENRSGFALNTPFAQYNRPICHKPGVNNFKLYYSKISHYDLGGFSADANVADTPIINANITGEINTWGWYQDAGDWDAYWTHSKAPANLLHLYESNPPLFDTMNLQLENESVNNFPDVLDEARWLIRCFKRCKDSIQTTLHDGTGGVPGGRIFGDNYPTSDGSNPEDGAGSWQDTKRKYVMLGESVHMTFIYAGLCAHLAKVIAVNGKTDPENINWQTEAINAWNWAIANTKTLDIVPNSGYNLATLRMYAAASLYKLTGLKTPYETQFIYDIDHLPNENSDLAYVGQGWYQAWDSINPIWQSIPTGFISNDDFMSLAVTNYYAGTQQFSNADAVTKARIKSTLIDGSDFLAGSNAWPSTINNRACRWGGNWWLPMGIGQSTTPYLNLPAICVTQFKNTADSNYVKDWIKNMYTTADYFMGCNPLNMTMISGLGEKTIPQIFHMDSWYCNNGNNINTKKGFVSYGTLRDASTDLGGAGGYPAPYKYYYGIDKSYPLPADRPGHERFMASRTAPIGNENTIHQTCISAIMTYGTLYALTPKVQLLPLFIPAKDSIVIVKNNTDKMVNGIYPNPANEYFSVQLDEKIQMIRLYNAGGLLCKTFEEDANNKYNIESIAIGNYIVEVETIHGRLEKFKLQKR